MLMERLYKLLVIYFRLINILVIFQKRINSVLGEHLNNNNIYLINEEEHGEYIKWVLKRLQKEKMLVVIKKYKFFTRKTNFVNFIIKLSKIRIDLKKVEAIVNQQKLENIIQLRQFLGFYNYYRRFIIQQLKNIKPFTRLIKKEELQIQGSKQKKLFKEFKE